MKNYLFIPLLLVFLIALGCSDKKSSPAKTEDSPKPIAAPSVSKTTNQSLIEQKKTPEPVQKQGTLASQPNVSGGDNTRVSGASTQHVSGIQNHISGQPRYSPNISGSQPHVSGGVGHPHISG